jgi:ribonuclease P protein component
MMRSPRAFAALEGARGRSTTLVAVRARRNDLDHDRFGISTGRKLGGAVERNRVRRRIREILRNWEHADPIGWDVLVVARPASASADFATLRTSLLTVLSQATTGQKVAGA